MKPVKLAAALVVVVLLWGLWGCRIAGRPSQTQGERAPTFTAPLLGEKKVVRVPEDFTGRVTVLLFFSPG